MSGICGVVTRGSLQASSDVIAAMCHSIRHRGPDGGGSFADNKRAAIGQLHLNTDARTKGGPPAFIEADGLVVAVDGFVLNRDDLLRNRSANEGPLVNRDAAAVAEAYGSTGDDAPAAVSGPVAFAVWDRAREQLVMARDRMGEKSVYYYVAPDGGSVVFGSEIKAILAHPQVPRALDLDGLAIYLAFGYIPGSWTLFKHVSKLLPGERLVFDLASGVRKDKYWSLPPLSDGDMSEDECVRRLRGLFLEAVAAYVGGADEVGVFLSGGVDSSLVVAALREIGVPRISTFSIGFDLRTPNPQHHEDLAYARIVADAFETQHHEVIVDADSDAQAGLPRALSQLDDLVMTPNSYSKYLLTSAVHNAGLAVAFTGSGTFGIERQFRDPKRRARLDRRLEGSTSDEERYYRMRAKLFPLDKQQELLSHPPTIGVAEIVSQLEDYFGGIESDDFFRVFTLAKAQVTRSEKNLKGWEKAGGLAGVEVRSPYLYHPMMEYCSQIPVSFDGGEHYSTLKTELRQGFADILPREVQERRVIGYPSYYWTNGELEEYQRALFSREAIAANDTFNFEALHRVIEDEKGSKSKSAGKRTWALTQFALWYEVHINRNPAYLVETD